MLSAVPHVISLFCLKHDKKSSRMKCPFKRSYLDASRNSAVIYKFGIVLDILTVICNEPLNAKAK